MEYISLWQLPGLPMIASTGCLMPRLSLITIIGADNIN